MPCIAILNEYGASDIAVLLLPRVRADNQMSFGSCPVELLVRVKVLQPTNRLALEV